MSSSLTLRGVQLLPLWKRRIPKYPVYWKGDPQLRVFLPQFWMKMLKPDYEIPSNQVHFEVHPQMSDLDIKNYLEKIYKVPVLSLKSELVKGDEVREKRKNMVVNREPDRRLVYLVLGEGHEFKFPEIFKVKSSPLEREMKDVNRVKRADQVEEQQSWERASVPPWFRY